jgi:hypothetical protein
MVSVARRPSLRMKDVLLFLRRLSFAGTRTPYTVREFLPNPPIVTVTTVVSSTSHRFFMPATHGARPRALIADLYRFYRDGSLTPLKRPPAARCLDATAAILYSAPSLIWVGARSVPP